MNTMSSIFAAAPMALGLTLAGCGSNPVCGDKNYDLVTDKDPCATMGTGGTGGTGGAGGSGGTGGVGGGMLIPGAEYAPKLSLPAMGEVLPPTRGFLAWQEASSIPAGRTVSGYQICQTAGPVSDIDDDAECPGSVSAASRFAVIDPLAEDSTVTWKARTLYQGGEFSAWSPLTNFMTDHSLAAWWRMNGDANDSSSSASNGSLKNGAAFSTGVDDQAMQCDGVDDYADMGTGLNIAGALTVSAWIYADGTPLSADSGILNKGTLNYALTHHTNGKVYFYVGNGGNNVSATVTPNAWHHVAGRFAGTASAGSLKLFVDGAMVASGTSTTATTGASGGLWVGRYGTSYYKGMIDNVTVYNGAFSDAALLNEYCATQAAGGVMSLPAVCQP